MYLPCISQVVSMVLQALPILATGCPLVLTFKQTLPSKGAWAAAVDAALRELGTIAEGVEVLHLLANTSKETTVVGRLRAGAGCGPRLKASGASVNREACGCPWL